VPVTVSLAVASAVYFGVVFAYCAIVAATTQAFFPLMYVLAVMGLMTGSFLVCPAGVLILVRNFGYVKSIPAEG
jgi:hypothetical protein